jgi:hypothetical protein
MGQVVVETAGCVVVADGTQIHFARRASGPIVVAIFVLALLVLIFGANGVLQLAWWLGGGHGSPQLGALLLTLAVGAAVPLWLVVQRYRRVRAGGVHTLPRLLTVDTSRGMLLDAERRDLAPVDRACSRRTFQLGSSNRALEVCWPGGSLVIAHGSPFAGDVGPIEEVLRARGVLPSR